MRVVFIGGGNMGRALAGGMIAQGRVPSTIDVVEISPEARERMQRDLGVRTFADPTSAGLEDAAVIVIAVKPQSMRETARALAPKLSTPLIISSALATQLSTPLIISIAAGIRLDDLSRWLNGYQRLVRAMPNTPALIRKGITGLYAHPSVTDQARAAAQEILGAVGDTIWCDREEQIDAITAVSGSGPAYVFYFLEAMIAGAESLGLSSEDARRLAYATASGAIKLAAQSSDSPSVLRAQVTSKGGTTEAALAILEAREVKAALIDAIAEADARARELGRLLGSDG